MRTKISIASVVLFVALSIAVTRYPILQIDRSVGLWLLYRTTPLGTVLMRNITETGNAAEVLLLTALAGVYLLSQNMQYWATRLVPTVVTGMVLNEALKVILYEMRSRSLRTSMRVLIATFPSGHALGATVLYGLLIVAVCSDGRSKTVRISVVTSCLLAILAISASRLYLQVHYFTDVIGGILEGIIWINVIGMIVDRKTTPLTNRATGCG